MNQIKTICVFCASSMGHNPNYELMADQLGTFLAQHDYTLVYGGGRVGLMGVLASAALSHEGKVIGIIPYFLNTKEIKYDEVSELYVVDSMHDRKKMMNEKSDAFIILPGGFGTFEEFFEVITWAQIGLHPKPVGILNVDGFYNLLLQFLDQCVVAGLLKQENRDMVLVSDKIDDLIYKMKMYEALPIPKWLDLSRSKDVT